MPPSPSRPSPSRRRQGPRPGGPPGRPDRPAPRRTPWAFLIGAVVLFAVAAAIGTATALRTWNLDRPARLLTEARAATDAGDWPRALVAWHAWNETNDRTAATLLIEAQLAGDLLHRGEAAERVAERATRLDPGLAAAWTFRINRLRVLDRSVEAMKLGLAALGSLRTAEGRRGVLKATTLATLAEVPDADARAELDRWIAADPADVAAQVARLSRIAANPHPGDPDRAARIVALQAILDRHPEHVAAREALAVALGDAGEVARGQAVLDGWPSADRGYRFDRLQGRWDLDFNRRPEQAAERFRAACLVAPHDWKSHYGLARAFRSTGHPDEAQAEALAVARLRERLDPATLGPRLTTAFARIDDGSDGQPTAAMTDLAALCRSVGLVPLADAWSQEAAPRPATSDPGGRHQ